MEDKTIRIEDLRLKHIRGFRKWQDHEDPLFRDYNYRDPLGLDSFIWYISKKLNTRSRYFSIIYQDIFIGFIGLKEIDKKEGRAILGLVLDPAYTGQGLASKALGKFLDYYFKELGFSHLYLEVASFNKRALGLYKKFNFEEIISYKELAYIREADLKSPYFLERQTCFKEVDGKLYQTTILMVLKKEEYIRGD